RAESLLPQHSVLFSIDQQLRHNYRGTTARAVTLSLTHTHTHKHTLSHTHTHTLSHTNTRTLTHTRCSFLSEEKQRARERGHRSTAWRVRNRAGPDRTQAWHET